MTTRRVTTRMIDEIIAKDLFPAGFVPRNLEYYYGAGYFAAAKAGERAVKRKDLKRINIRTKTGSKGYYFYYK